MKDDLIIKGEGKIVGTPRGIVWEDKKDYTVQGGEEFAKAMKKEGKKLAKKYKYPPIYEVRNISQYYIPKIEEFYVGFEYEELWKKIWHQKTIQIEDFNGSIDFPCTLYEINNNLQFADVKNYRVKYLDRKDIEELGYRVEEEFDKDNNICKYNFYIRKTDNDFDNVIGEYWIKTKHLIINNEEEYDGYISYFMGRIRNKSELKILIDQLELELELK